MKDPINILDHIIAVVPCSECDHEFRLPFSLTLTGQEFECPICNHPQNLQIGGTAAPRIEENFQMIQAQARGEGCWVEVLPYPSHDN